MTCCVAWYTSSLRSLCFSFGGWNAFIICYSALLSRYMSLMPLNSLWIQLIIPTIMVSATYLPSLILKRLSSFVNCTQSKKNAYWKYISILYKRHFFTLFVFVTFFWTSKSLYCRAEQALALIPQYITSLPHSSSLFDSQHLSKIDQSIAKDAVKSPWDW